MSGRFALGPRETERRRWAAGPAARWLPRALAASLLTAGLLAAFRFDEHGNLPFARGIQGVIVVAGAALGLWVLRAGAESRVVAVLEPRRLLLEHGGHVAGVEFHEMRRLEFEWPLAASRRLWPATVVVDRFGRSWRLPAVLRHGDALIAELLRRSARDDLRTWAETLRVERRMRLGPWIVVLGYGLAGSTLLAALVFYGRS